MDSTENKSQLKKQKCAICKKKHFIINICRCGKIVCLKHRYPDTHNCTFDFKNDEETKIDLGESCEFKKIEKI